MKDIIVGGVRVTLLGEDEVKPEKECMLAVLVHGRGQSREASQALAEHLRAKVPGLVCAIWDLPNHGQRLVDAVVNRGWQSGNPLHLVQMHSIIVSGTAEAANILRDVPFHLPDHMFSHRVIIGCSLGGYITWNVAGNYSNLLSAAVPIISSPDIPRIMKERWNKFEHKMPAEAAAAKSLGIPDSVMEDLRQMTAKNLTLQKSSLAMLAICGGDDPLVPPESTIEWGLATTLAQRVEIVPGVKHEVPPEIMDLTAEYLNSLLTC